MLNYTFPCRENALVEHLAETFHVIFGDVDFTVSDRHVALVLATALQQNRRHERIRECLLEGADPLASPFEQILLFKVKDRTSELVCSHKFLPHYAGCRFL